jgi:hypothetical protein
VLFFCQSHKKANKDQWNPLKRPFSFLFAQGITREGTSCKNESLFPRWDALIKFFYFEKTKNANSNIFAKKLPI